MLWRCYTHISQYFLNLLFDFDITASNTPTVAVKSEGVGRLFDKVELEEEEGESGKDMKQSKKPADKVTVSELPDDQ